MLSIRRAVGLGVEIPVCEEPLEKEKKGKADFLECRPQQHRVPQKAELDTRCVCRKFTSGTCISRNWSGRRESKTKVGYQAKHCGNWGSVLQGALRELCGIHLQIVHQEDKRKIMHQLSSAIGQELPREVFMNMYFQDCTCFRTAESFPEGILTDSKIEVPG